MLVALSFSLNGLCFHIFYDKSRMMMRVLQYCIHEVAVCMIYF